MNDMTPPAQDRAPPAFNPLDPAFIADPYPFYRALRETAPVFKTPQGFWLMTRYEDVAFALRDRRFGKDFAGNMQRRYGDRPAWTSRRSPASPTPCWCRIRPTTRGCAAW